jgi:hypothetical protein
MCLAKIQLIDDQCCREVEIVTASELYEMDDPEGFLAVPNWTVAASVPLI